MDKKVLSKEGLIKLKEELDYLQNTKRPQVSERIKLAKEFGDLSENAEYQEAKDEQAFVEGRILELEHLIKTSIVADDNQTNDVVNIGSEVVLDREGQVMRLTIVGSTEAEPASGRISLESPFGKALLGRKVGDEVEIKLPTSQVKCKILEIH